jgi:hypothetical protein
MAKKNMKFTFASTEKRTYYAVDCITILTWKDCQAQRKSARRFFCKKVDILQSIIVSPLEFLSETQAVNVVRTVTTMMINLRIS